MFSVSEAALNEIHRQLLKRKNINDWVKIGIAGGGCSGYQYIFEWFTPTHKMLSEHVSLGHAVIDFKNGVNVLIDIKSMKLLSETTLDFKSGVTEHGFKFVNPEVTSTCGCGKSIAF